MLTIRLSRTGKRKQPYYRLIVSEKSKDPWGRYLELLGNYNPRSKQANFKKERIEYWLSQGAQTSPTVKNLLINLEIISGKKTSPVNISKRRAAKLAKTKSESKAKAEAETAKQAESEAAIKKENEPAETAGETGETKETSTETSPETQETSKAETPAPEETKTE